MGEITEEEKEWVIDQIGTISANVKIIKSEFRNIIPKKYKNRPIGKQLCKIQKKNSK